MFCGISVCVNVCVSLFLIVSCAFSPFVLSSSSLFHFYFILFLSPPHICLVSNESEQSRVWI